MGCFDDSLTWIINFASLAENVVTTLYFDEDHFGTITLALIFCFEPVLDAIVKQLMNCTKCDWDNFAYDLISEGIQCFLYIHFCSYDENAVLILPILMAIQVFCMIVLKVKEKCSKQEEQSEEQKQMQQGLQVMGCIMANCQGVCTGIFPLFYLLYSEEAPYRQKYFEVVLACYYWVADISLQFQFTAVQEAMAGEGKVSKCTLLEGKWIARIASLLQFAFMVFTAVLAWIYWFSGDCNEDFDKGYTMFTMVMSCFIICYPCALMQQRKQQNAFGGMDPEAIGATSVMG